MFDQILWFSTRGAGIVSLLLSTTVVCLGFATVARWQAPGWPRFLTVELHRSIALLSIVFVAIHVVTAILDPFTSLGVLAADRATRFILSAGRGRLWRRLGRPARSQSSSRACSASGSATGSGARSTGSPGRHGRWPSSTA